MVERYVKRAPILARLLAIPAFLGLMYLSWTYVSANVDLDFPPNTMGAAMVMPLKLLACTLMVGAGMTLFIFLTINLPRSVLAATALVLLVFGSVAFWGSTPRDLLNLATVLVTPPLMVWLIVRPTKKT